MTLNHRLLLIQHTQTSRKSCSKTLRVRYSSSKCTILKNHSMFYFEIKNNDQFSPSPRLTVGSIINFSCHEQKCPYQDTFLQQ